jgi:hypothetical protein
MNAKKNSDIFVVEEIPCSFRKIVNYPEEGTKSGRYSGCLHWDIKDFAYKKWVILGYIDLDWVSLTNQGKSKDEIILGCLQHLNVVPERKKHAKKDPQPKYGLLEPYKADFKENNGKPFIIVQFKTNERNNPNFWSEGPSWNGEMVGKKRGRPPKIKTENEQ